MVNEFNIAVDRSMLLHLQSLAQAVIERMESIKARYPEGTFDDTGGVEEEGEEEIDPNGPAPPEARTQKRGRPRKKKATPARAPKGVSLSEAIRAYLSETPRIDIHEFAALNPNLRKGTMYPVLRSMAKAGHVTQDPETRSTYYRK